MPGVVGKMQGGQCGWSEVTEQENDGVKLGRCPELVHAGLWRPQ